MHCRGRRRRIEAAQQQHPAVLVKQDDPGRGAEVGQRRILGACPRAVDDFEICWHRRGSTQTQPTDRAAYPQCQGVAHGIIVKASRDQHARLGIGELGHQSRPQPVRVDGGQRGGELVFGVFAPVTFGTFGFRRQLDQLLVLECVPYRTCDDGATSQRSIECLPGQVTAHVQPVQAVGHQVGPEQAERNQ
ncbi:Uncharacterised protein [Mycobacteroides abscessus subsp. abscessus]|nr:Uncharacterised protein [Mycobacteroides abscessus subsp. abscessus]